MKAQLTSCAGRTCAGQLSCPACQIPRLWARSVSLPPCGNRPVELSIDPPPPSSAPAWRSCFILAPNPSSPGSPVVFGSSSRARSPTWLQMLVTRARLKCGAAGVRHTTDRGRQMPAHQFADIDPSSLSSLGPLPSTAM